MRSLCPAYLIVNLLKSDRWLVLCTKGYLSISSVKGGRNVSATKRRARRSNAGFAAPVPICNAMSARGLRYFFSSVAWGAGAAAGACVGGAVGVCEAPDMPSLKLRMPSPNPFMISGMRFPPKKINTIAKTISQCIGLSNINSSRDTHNVTQGPARFKRCLPRRPIG